MRFLPRRKAVDPMIEDAKAQARADAAQRRQQEREEAAGRQRQGRAARDQAKALARTAREEAASRWAHRALAIPTVVWMEGVLWGCTVAALAVAYALSYSHQSGVFEQLDYGGWEHLAVPLALDLPLTASIAGLYLSARWKSPRLQRWAYRGMTLLTAPLSLGANALHGSVTHGVVDWSRVLEPVHLVSSLIPALIVLACVLAAEVTFGEKARLDELAARGGPIPERPVIVEEQAPVIAPTPQPGPAHEAPTERPTDPAQPRKSRAAQGAKASRPKRSPRAAQVSGPGERPSVADVAAHIRAQLDDGRPLKDVTKASVGRSLGLPRSTAQRMYDDALALLRAEPDGPLALNVGPAQEGRA